MRWDRDRLIVDINEMSTPHGQRIRGNVTLHPSALTTVEALLTPTGTHIWRPFAPTAEIEVNLDRPGWTWRGHGYFDSNFGTAALEADFSYWTWARLPMGDGSACLYDADRRDGSELQLAVAFDKDGSHRRIEAPPKTRLPRSLWALRRETRADTGYRPKQVKHMLDAPFYNRAAIRTKINGEETEGVYEALDLDRFANPLLKPMLAVRVPRRRTWRF